MEMCSDSSFTKRLQIIKLGGAAITKKDELETVKHKELTAAAKLIKKLTDKGVSCVIVHGAGSFGHHQASEYGVNKGNTIPNNIRLQEGFCKTRLSVTKLNHIVTDYMIQEGVPAIGVQACGYWKTSAKHVIQDGSQALEDLLRNGYVPVLHGDCVLDEDQGCCILSGDTIIKRLSEVLLPEKVVFLTDVDGIYDKPPEQPGAELLQRIGVKPDGDIDVPITTSTKEKDVSGGIALKINSAVSIVLNSKGSIPVTICNIAGRVAEAVCLSNDTPDNATFIEYLIKA